MKNINNQDGASGLIFRPIKRTFDNILIRDYWYTKMWSIEINWNTVVPVHNKVFTFRL